MTIETLLSAILIVESGGNPNPPDGDGGRSIGPYQIMRAYWKDSGSIGQYEQCRDHGYARATVIRYWHRYCKAELKRALDGKATMRDFAKLARVHNGGPSGHRKRATMAYWRRVQKAMNSSRKR